MDRRTAVRNLALVIGGALVLPACDRKANQASIALKKVNLNANDEALIAEVAETIIPKTDTPGAKDLSLHQFIMKMVDDCLKKEDQDAFVAGIKDFNDEVKKTYHKSFAELPTKQREQFLLRFEQPNQPKSDLTSFYGTTKWLTVYGYTNSKFFMTKEIVYELVPGRYNGYYPVSKLKEKHRYASS
jgi:hypothetical protein